MKKKRQKELRIAIKMIACIVYLIAITILSVCAYRLFEYNNRIVPWSQVENVENYTYIDIYKMSEKFAYYEDYNIGIHFVIEKEETGLWHTYLIAINEDNYDQFKGIIDYTYERTDQVPEPIRVYGYPTIVKDDLKQMAIKNISNFVPAENEVIITDDNYDTYLTNSYLDTTLERQDQFSVLFFIVILLGAILFLLLVATLLDKDKIVDNIDEKIELEMKKGKKRKRSDRRRFSWNFKK